MYKRRSLRNPVLLPQLSQGRYQKGRKWLMWCLLHFMTSTIPSKAAQVVHMYIPYSADIRQYTHTTDYIDYVTRIGNGVAHK